MLMLPHVGGQLWVYNPAECHKPKREPCDCDLSKPVVHKVFIEEPLPSPVSVSESLTRHR